MRLMETLRSEYIKPRNWFADINKNDKNDPEPPRYYEWMLWKLRQERKKDVCSSTRNN